MVPRARRPLALAAFLSLLAGTPIRVPDSLAADASTALKIGYPAEGTLFPPDSVAPTVLWSDGTARVNRWNVVVRDHHGTDVVQASVDEPRWRPSEADWKRVKERSAERDVEIAVTGVDQTNPASVLSSARVHVRTSKDQIGRAHV